MNNKVVVDIVNESSSLGDTLAWVPMVNEYAKKHNIKINFYNNSLSFLFENQYPLINFTDYQNKKYIRGDFLSLFYDLNLDKQHTLQKSAADKLKIEWKGYIKPKLNIDRNKKSNFDRKYVCIATQSTAQAKYWNNPKGWKKTVAYLKFLGYDVVCIDKNFSYGIEGSINYIPEGCVDKTGDLPLEDRINDLLHCDFFIGLGSGLSWLAWACEKPVIMISGFSKPCAEFYTPYRVINENVCNGCWNSEEYVFDPNDWLWCPEKKDFECTKQISFEMIKKNISKLRKKELK